MARALLFWVCLLGCVLPVAAEDRFPPVHAAMSSESTRRATFEYDAGDMHATAQGNDTRISWKTTAGTEGIWVMSPDCFQDQVKCDEDTCAHSSFPCYGKCIMSLPQIHLYDSRDKKLYFSVALDVGSNVPHAVFVADLDGRRATFLFEAAGSGLTRFTFSPSDSWLAFLEGSHGSACASSLHLRIFDMRKKRLSKPLVIRSDKSISLRENVSYESIMWLSDSQLRLAGKMWNCRNVDAVDEVTTEAVVNIDDNLIQ